MTNRRPTKGTKPYEEACDTNGFLDDLSMIEIWERDDLLDELKL